MTHRFTTTLWRYQGEAAWYFVTLPHDVGLADLDDVVLIGHFGFYRPVDAF